MQPSQSGLTMNDGVSGLLNPRKIPFWSKSKICSPEVGALNVNEEPLGESLSDCGWPHLRTKSSFVVVPITKPTHLRSTNIG